MNPDTPLVFSNPGLDESLLPAPIPWIWIMVASAAVLVIGLTLLISWLRSRKNFATLDRQCAYQAAIRALEEADSLDPHDAAIAASLAIRRYLCAVAGDPSLFQTHEEFLARHPSISHWPQETLDSLIQTLKQLADLKYRPLEDGQNDPSQLLSASRELLRALEQGSAA